MEASEEEFLHSTHTDDPKPQSQQQSLGLPVDQNPDTNLDPPPVVELQNLALKDSENEGFRNPSPENAAEVEVESKIEQEETGDGHRGGGSGTVIDDAVEGNESERSREDEKEPDREEDVDENGGENEVQGLGLGLNEASEKGPSHEEDVQKEIENGDLGTEGEIINEEENNWSEIEKQEVDNGNDYRNLNQEDIDEENNRSENEKQEVDNGNEYRNLNEMTKDEEDVDGENSRSENEKELGDSEDEYEHVNENEIDSVNADSVSASHQKDSKYGRFHYPLRADAEDCAYYMKTGMCKFGSHCKFNHPPRRRNQVTKEKVKPKEENPERVGQTDCKYYLTTGGCKYGKACRYNHNRENTSVSPIMELNFLGLPIRQGEKECHYYMRTGSCKYGSNCRFNHPDPTTVGGADPPAGYVNGRAVPLQGAPQSTLLPWSSPRTLNDAAPFVPLMFSPTQGVPSPTPEWNGYQAPVYPSSDRSLPTPPAFALNSPAINTNFYTHQHQHQQQQQQQHQMVVDEFPERPGQPECSYFLKTGECKYKSNCKFDHPKNRFPKTPPCILSDKGLPLRPDQNICSHYNRYGICKFGPSCKFDHPENYGDSSAAFGQDQPRF